MKPLPSLRAANPALLVSSLAMLVSLASLLVSIQQTNLARRQQAASVWPYLQIDYQTAATLGQREFEVIIHNKGIGPALIQRVRLRHQGQEYDDFYRLFKAKYPSPNFNHTLNSLSGMVLSAGEKKTLVSVSDTLAATAMYQVFQETEIRVAYASVYGDLWLMDEDTVSAIRSLREIK